MNAGDKIWNLFIALEKQSYSVHDLNIQAHNQNLPSVTCLLCSNQLQINLRVRKLNHNAKLN